MKNILRLLLPLSVLLTACVKPAEQAGQGAVVTKLVTTSVTQVGFLAALDRLDVIAGVCNPELIYTPLPDSIPNMGDALQPDIERILQSGAQAVLVTSYVGSEQWTEQLNRAGVQVVRIDEWKEPTPLKRAEWIKTVGALIGEEKRADSVYAAVATAYEAEKATEQGLSLVSGQDFRGTWYVPAGGTYMGQLFRDAGATYRYADDPRTQSIPLMEEQALREFKDADIWIGVNARSLSELKAIDNKHAWMKAFQTEHVYNFLKQTTPTGGNNFWERGVVHPEEILHDLRLIVHQQEGELFYVMQLEP